MTVSSWQTQAVLCLVCLQHTTAVVSLLDNDLHKIFIGKK